MKDKWKKRIVLFWRGWGYSIVAALIIATSFKSAIADWYDIPSGSMKPTILIGDRVFVNKLAYGLKAPYTTLHLLKWAVPKRGDIVVFYSPEDGKRLIKRVAGIPGDTIAMVKNRFIINGEAIEYTLPDTDSLMEGKEVWNLKYLVLNEKLPGREHKVIIEKSNFSGINSFGPITVPGGEYFMLGDNRDNSADSRIFGFVKQEKIVGRATAVVLSRDGSFFHPRWERLFKSLL